MSNLCPMPGLCMTLAENVLIGENQLCLPNTFNNKVTEALGADKHTYFVISNGVSCEYVKVQVDATDPNKLIMSERGLEWTSESNFVKGASVKFDWTALALEDMLACLEAETEEPDFCVADHTWNPDTNCFEPDDDSEGSDTLTFRDCQNEYTIKGINFTAKPLDGSLILQEGTYTNPEVTVDKSGCIVCIKDGSTSDDSSLTGGCGCCGKCNGGCGSTTEASDKVNILACQAIAPATDSSYCLWLNMSDACLYVLCEGTWLSTGLRVQAP